GARHFSLDCSLRKSESCANGTVHGARLSESSGEPDNNIAGNVHEEALMNRFIPVEAPSYGKPTCLLARSLRGAVPILLILWLVFVGRAPAGVINGDFHTGDLTGWDANTLNPSLSAPATVDVITVGSSLVGDVQFSSLVGGHYAGSLSQDFYTAGATKL